MTVGVTKSRRTSDLSRNTCGLHAIHCYLPGNTDGLVAANAPRHVELLSHAQHSPQVHMGAGCAGHVPMSPSGKRDRGKSRTPGACLTGRKPRCSWYRYQPKNQPQQMPPYEGPCERGRRADQNDWTAPSESIRRRRYDPPPGPAAKNSSATIHRQLRVATRGRPRVTTRHVDSHVFQRDTWTATCYNLIRRRVALHVLQLDPTARGWVVALLTFPSATWPKWTTGPDVDSSATTHVGQNAANRLRTRSTRPITATPRLCHWPSPVAPQPLSTSPTGGRRGQRRAPPRPGPRQSRWRSGKP